MNTLLQTFGHKKELTGLKTALITGCIAVLIALTGSPALASANFNSEAGILDKGETVADSTKIYEVVDQMPEIEGGIKSVYKHIEYPKPAIAGNIEGRVFVRFVVNEKGEVENPTILKDIGAGCGKAAVSGLKKVKFKPGKLKGQPVKVYYTLPITFEIQK